MGNGSDRLEAGDQSYFLRGWRTYRKVRDLDYMFHRDVYDALHRVLLADAARPFRFVDIGCGDAASTVAALQGAEVGSYVGIDVSRPALDLARAELQALSCPVTLVESDFRAALAGWQEPVDVVWIGQSLHHVLADEKLAVMREVRRVLSPGGLFLIWEPTSLPGEETAGWVARVDAYVHTWPGLDAEERTMVVEHCRASDHPETAARWLTLAREAGFASAHELLEAPPRLGTVYQFRA